MHTTFPHSLMLRASLNRIENTIRSGFKVITQSLTRKATIRRIPKAQKAVIRKAELEFITFITNAALNSAFRDDLHWQIENFNGKSDDEKIKLFPGFYLFIERYIFNAVETSQQSFREALYLQFGEAIHNNSTLKLIFLSPERQVVALYRRFLFSVAARSARSLRRTSPIVQQLLDVLNGKSDSIFSESPETLSETDRYIALSNRFYTSFAQAIGEKNVLKIYNDAYDNLLVRYQNLTTFPEMLKLFPGRALDETKYNLLSTQQMKRLLAEKVEALENATAELQEKNKQLANQFEELSAQSELLNLQNDQLSEAHTLITMMNEELNSHSRKLEEKVAERTAELAHSNSLLTLYNENLEQYTFAISHQLKAPVARLMGLTNLLRILPESERTVVCENLFASAKELDTIFKELVHSLNLKADTANVKTGVFNIEETASTLLKTSTSNTDIHVDFINESNAIIESSEEHVTECLRRIIDNAVKFQKAEGNQQIQVTLSRNENNLVVEVADNGEGFNAEEVRSRIFTPFSCFNTTHNGRGMGLYHAKQHIAILGGSITIDSEIGKGTKVQVTLPVTWVENTVESESITLVDQPLAI